MLDNDDSARLIDAVCEAYANKQSLSLCGTGSKQFLGEDPGGSILSIVENSGVLEYQPKELVLTARAGTRLDKLVPLLAANGQQLPFDPPTYGGQGTLGGALATGLSGPARVWQGSARDAVLGMQIVNGMGQHLKFGGQVLKNVAGYDVSRLMTGAYGTLGLILSASIRLLPLPAFSLTVQLKMDQTAALDFVLKYLRSANAITATCYVDQYLYLRLSGSEAAVRNAVKPIGGQIVLDSINFWEQIRDHRHTFFTGQGIWRFSLPPASDYPGVKGQWMTEWAGAQRWLKSEASSKKEVQFLYDCAKALGGHISCYRAPASASGQVGNMVFPKFSKLSPALMKYHLRLKQAFDPAGILNAGRLYPDF